MDAAAYRAFVAKINDLQELEARQRTELLGIRSESAAVAAIVDQERTGLEGEANQSAIEKAQLDVELHRVNLKIDEMKRELDKALEARHNAAKKLLEGEQRLADRREFYSAKKASLEAEQQEIDAWFVNKPRWKKAAALREEAQALDEKMAEITRSPSELEQLKTSLQDVTQRAARLSDACKRSEMEAKDLRAGRVVREAEITVMQTRVREISEQRRETELMMAEDIMEHAREKSSQERALAELHSHLESLREQAARRGQQLDEKRRRLLAEKNRFFQSASILHKRQQQAPW